MTTAQHVWLRPDATSYEAVCEVCLHTRESIAVRHTQVSGTLRRGADVAFTSCGRGHRIVVRRINRALETAW